MSKVGLTAAWLRRVFRKADRSVRPHDRAGTSPRKEVSLDRLGRMGSRCEKRSGATDGSSRTERDALSVVPSFFAVGIVAAGCVVTGLRPFNFAASCHGRSVSLRARPAHADRHVSSSQRLSQLRRSCAVCAINESQFRKRRFTISSNWSQPKRQRQQRGVGREKDTLVAAWLPSIFSRADFNHAGRSTFCVAECRACRLCLGNVDSSRNCSVSRCECLANTRRHFSARARIRVFNQHTRTSHFEDHRLNYVQSRHRGLAKVTP